MYPETIRVKKTSAFGRLDVVSDREGGVTYRREDPPSDALVRLVRDMKALGLWDDERGCPVWCEDSVKWKGAER